MDHTVRRYEQRLSGPSVCPLGEGGVVRARAVDMTDASRREVHDPLLSQAEHP